MTTTRRIMTTSMRYLCLICHIYSKIQNSLLKKQNFSNVILNFRTKMMRNDHNLKNKNLKFDFPLYSADSGSFM